MFKKCDEIVSEQKSHLSRVKRLLLILTIIITIVKVIVSVITVLSPKNGPILKLSLDLFIGASLVFAVLHMRRSVQSIRFTEPNNKMVILHIVNFSVWSVLYAVYSYGYFS